MLPTRTPHTLADWLASPPLRAAAGAAILGLSLSVAPRAQSYFQSFGTPCAGTSHITPTLTGDGCLCPGRAITLTVNGPASTIGVLGISYGEGSFPLRPGCDLAISIDPVDQPVSITITTNANGVATLAIPLAAGLSPLVGLRLYSQAVLLEPALSLSNALEITGAPRVFRSTGTGLWNAPSTWQRLPAGAPYPPGIPGVGQDYDVVKVESGHTVTQLQTLPSTLGLYILEQGATHVLDNHSELKAINVEAFGTLNVSAPVAGVYIDRTVVVRNAAEVTVTGDLMVQRVYDDPGYCNLINNAPAPFDSYGPITDMPEASPPDEDDEGAAPVLFHEDTTHPALTAVTMDIAQNVLTPPEDYLCNELGMPKGIDTVVGPSASNTLLSYAVKGAKDEDAPVTRVLKHFLNPYTDAGLFLINDPADAWAKDNSNNLFNFDITRTHFFDALTKPLPADRNLAFVNTFEGIGHILHLIQDMASAAHCRTDAHPIYRAIEDHAQFNFDSIAALDNLGAVTTIPAASKPPRYTLLGPILPPVSEFRDFWDTDQLVAGVPFGGFYEIPGLAELVNLNFWSLDTVLDPKHPRPSVADTDLAASFPAPTYGQVIYGDDVAIPTPLSDGWVPVYKPTGTTGIDVPILAAAKNLGQNTIRSWFSFLVGAPERIVVSIYNVVTAPGPASVLDGYSQLLLPLAIRYGTSFVNYFFRGNVDIRVAWDQQYSVYRLTIINETGEALGAGTWRLYQDDSAGHRALAAFLPYPGNSLAANGSFNATFSPLPNRDGGFTLVFRGTIGNEVGTGVIGRAFDVLSVRATWSPNADGDVYLYDFDDTLVWDANPVGPNSEHDVDYGVGPGPEGITVHTLKPGRLQFMVNYGEDWNKEMSVYSGGCTLNTPALFAFDNPADPCYVQTTNTMTVRTYLNSDSPMAVRTRTFTRPDRSMLPPNNTAFGAVGDSWFVTLIADVAADGTLTLTQ